MDHYGGEDYYGGGSLHLVCDYCRAADDYDPDDAEDGLFTCRQCSAVHTATQPTAADPGDFPLPGNISVRRRPTQPTPTPKLFTPARPFLATPISAMAPAFDDLSELRDFASPPPGAATAAAAWGDGGDPEDLAARVRWRYVSGLQVILQRQLEVLVERHRVSPLVCGVAGTVWARWVDASKVLGEMWARKVLSAAAARRPAGGDDQNPEEVKHEWEDVMLHRRDRKRAEYLFLRSLRAMLPVYSTLAVCFLACHIAREAILPTDIFRWAMESKLPYLTVFSEVDKLLGSSVKECPFDSRQMFRPIRVIGPWQLEAAAGSIAQRLGLKLPSVNFYSIAQRYLKQLSLPIEKILPHACRIYEWAMPADLWLPSNPARVPTRVCVMAILIVALRKLYKINGQGIWERIGEPGGNAGASDSDVNPPHFVKPGSNNGEEFCASELLYTLAAAYEKIDVGHDYSKELHSYLKYCKNTVFPGTTDSAEAHLIEIFLDINKGKEDKNPKLRTEEMKTANGVNKRCRDGSSVATKCFSDPSRNDALQLIKSEMEDHGFYYISPREQRDSDGYLHYRRKMLTGHLLYVAHADYYILLRAFAKLAEVDVRILHTSVLKLERRLAWIEQRIASSLGALQNLPSIASDEQRSVSG